MNFLFKEFNATNLNDDIKEVVDLNDEEVPLEVQLKKYLLPRLNIFVMMKLSTTFLRMSILKPNGKI